MARRVTPSASRPSSRCSASSRSSRAPGGSCVAARPPAKRSGSCCVARTTCSGYGGTPPSSNQPGRPPPERPPGELPRTTTAAIGQPAEPSPEAPERPGRSMTWRRVLCATAWYQPESTVAQSGGPAVGAERVRPLPVAAVHDVVERAPVGRLELRELLPVGADDEVPRLLVAGGGCAPRGLEDSVQVLGRDRPLAVGPHVAPGPDRIPSLHVDLPQTRPERRARRQRHRWCRNRGQAAERCPGPWPAWRRRRCCTATRPGAATSRPVAGSAAGVGESASTTAGITARTCGRGGTWPCWRSRCRCSSLGQEWSPSGALAVRFRGPTSPWWPYSCRL